MSDFTPTTEQVRSGFATDPIAEYHDPLTNHTRLGERAFDRWLVEHDRRIKAAAWDRGIIDANVTRTTGRLIRCTDPVLHCTEGDQLVTATEYDTTKQLIEEARMSAETKRLFAGATKQFSAGERAQYEVDAGRLEDLADALEAALPREVTLEQAWKAHCNAQLRPGAWYGIDYVIGFEAGFQAALPTPAIGLPGKTEETETK